MRLENFTLRGQETIQSAIEAAERNQHIEVEPEHLLLAMLEQSEGIVRQLISKLDTNVQIILLDSQTAISRLPKVEGGQQYFSPRTTQVFQAAQKEAEQMRDEYVSTEHLLLAITAEKDGASGRILRQYGVNRDDLFKVVEQTRGGARVTDQNAEANYQSLSKFAKDLTELARQGKLDPVIGRDDEIRRTVQVLSRRTKNNPMLIGEPGVGKTAIVEGLAQRIISGDVPETLRNKRLIALDLWAMLAGAKYRGEFEERLQAVLKEIENAQGQVVPIIDELHTLFGPSAPDGTYTALNMLKPALSSSILCCVGVVTTSAYKKYIEKDETVGGYFQPIFVDEPSIEDALTIVRGLKERYEVHHGVRIKDSAVIAAVELSNQHIKARLLPSKAIDLMDEAAACLRIETDTLPHEIDQLEREIRQLEINKLSLQGETDERSMTRLRELESLLMPMRDEASNKRAKWLDEKALVERVQRTRAQILHTKTQAEQFEREGNFAKVAEMRYGKLIELQDQLDADQTLSTNLEYASLLGREVDEEDIFKLVDRWGGISLSKLKESESQISSNSGQQTD